jgi:hypothetical protein
MIIPLFGKMRNEKGKKKKKERSPVGNEIMLPVPLFTENGEMHLCIY